MVVCEIMVLHASTIVCDCGHGSTGYEYVYWDGSHVCLLHVCVYVWVFVYRSIWGRAPGHDTLCRSCAFVVLCWYVGNMLSVLLCVLSIPPCLNGNNCVGIT